MDKLDTLRLIRWMLVRFGQDSSLENAQKLLSKFIKLRVAGCAEFTSPTSWQQQITAYTIEIAKCNKCGATFTDQSSLAMVKDWKLREGAVPCPILSCSGAMEIVGQEAKVTGIRVSLEDVRVIFEQCQWCRFWELDLGCGHPDAMGDAPIDGCPWRLESVKLEAGKYGEED